MLEGSNCYFIMLNLGKLFLENEGEITIFLDGEKMENLLFIVFYDRNF